MDEGPVVDYVPPPKLVAATPPFDARFDGSCSGCTFPVSIGQQIVRMSDDSYRHRDCA